jgi:hypothetical protein
VILCRLEERLKKLDKEVIEMRYKLRNDEAKFRKSEAEISKKKLNRLNKRDFVIQAIKNSDMIDLCYLRELIEEEKKHILQENIKNPPLKNYIKHSEPSSKHINVPFKTVAEELQSEHSHLHTSNPHTDFPSFKSSLLLQKRLSAQPHRSSRGPIQIFLIDRFKTNSDYSRSQICISNPRNPFEPIEDLHYHLESEDSYSSDFEDQPEFVGANSDIYNRRFLGDGRDNKVPVVEVYDQSNVKEVMETCKIRMLTKMKKMKLQNGNHLPRLTESVQKNLKKIVEIINGAYAKKEDLISSICIKLNVPEEDIKLNFHKLCDKERRIGDAVWRWYVKDEILSYLSIDENKAISMINDKDTGESKKTRDKRQTIEGRTPFKNFKSSSVSKNFDVFRQNFQENKPKPRQFTQFTKTQDSMGTNIAVKGSSCQSDDTQNLAELTNNPEKLIIESIEETQDVHSDHSADSNLEIRSAHPDSVVQNPFISQHPSNQNHLSETSSEEYLYF